jgi:HTH-type transcriptional regulator/antitoxin MqsA
MHCPSCGTGTLVPDTRDVVYTYRGRTTVLPQMTGDFCTACDEAVMDLAESRRSMDLMLAFRAQADPPARPG